MSDMFIGGPMAIPAEDADKCSIFNKRGGHYNIFKFRSEPCALAVLQNIFPDGIANELNFVLFSTSGVHGTYTTLEEIESDIASFGGPPPSDGEYHPRSVTVLLVQPRLVGMSYGECSCRCVDDVEFLKKLRASSWSAVRKIGAAK